MSDDTSRNTSTNEPATDWQRLRSMTDEQVRAAITEDPDIVPTDDAFWADAYVTHEAVQPQRRQRR